MTMAVSLFQLLVAVTVMLFSAVFLVLRLGRTKRKQLPPGPSPWPFLGNWTEMSSDQPTHVTFMELKQKYGDIFLVHIGRKPSVVLNNIALVKEAFIQKGDDLAGRPQYSSARILTEGGQDIALGQYGDSWQFRHRVAQAAFTRYTKSDHLEEMLHQSLVPVLEYMRLEDEPFNPISILSMLVYNMMCAMCLGKTFALDDPTFQKIVAANEQAMEAFGRGLASDSLPWLGYLPGSGWELKRYTNRFLGYLYKAVGRHRDTYNPENQRDLTHELVHQQKTTSPSSTEEDTSELLTDTQLVQILSDLFFGLHNRICLSHRDSLPYVHATLFEVLRMRPWVPLTLPHQALRDTKLGNYEVPAGYHCYANIWALHYDKEHWQNPDSFNPDRFLDGNNKQLGHKPASWLPFSTGLRSCLGETLVNLQLPLIAATLLQQFTFLAPEAKELQVLRRGAADRQTTVPEPFTVLAKMRT